MTATEEMFRVSIKTVSGIVNAPFLRLIVEIIGKMYWIRQCSSAVKSEYTPSAP